MLKKICLVLVGCALSISLNTTAVAGSYVDFEYIDEYQNNKMLTAYQWQLGKQCADIDICHMYAQADMFGLGAGIFPKELIPRYPAHPDCDCRLSVLSVYEKNTDDRVQQIDKAGNAWLGKQPRAVTQKLFSSSGYQIWQATGLWQPLLRNWHGLAAPHSKSILLSMELNLKLPSDKFLVELAILQNSKYTPGKSGKDRYYDDRGEPIWPSNKGFRGKPYLHTLAVGVVVDKMGVRPRGNFLALPQVSRSERAVPDKGKYLEIYQTVHTFKTTEQVHTYAGTIAPWFGEVGLGIQYYVPAGIENTKGLQLLDSSTKYLQLDEVS